MLEFKRSVFKGVLEDGDDVVINGANNKGFMESVEELTEGARRDFYVTPHAEGDGDEEFDYEVVERGTVKKKWGKGDKLNSKILRNILKPVGLVGWFMRKVFGK